MTPRGPGLVANTDPSGEVGRRVAERLAARGVRQRLLVAPGVTAPELPGAEVAHVADGDDGSRSLTAALSGVGTLFFVPVREVPDRVARHAAVVDAAVAAGVGRIVYSSFLGASPTATFTLARDHHATEERIRATGLPFTILRGSAYLEVLRWIIGADGVIRGPGGTGRLAPVGRDDVADVAARVVAADGRHDGVTYDLTGPELVSLGDIAEAFGRATGRAMSYEDEPLERARESRRALGAPEWQVEAWVSTYLQVARGELETVSDAVPRLTGHPALSLPAYLAAHPEHLADLVAAGA
jgi:NAD(P)H dehydrogenase (quinone)